MSKGFTAVDPERFNLWANQTGLAWQPPFSVHELGGGKSNITLALTDAEGRRLVVRRPPAGVLLPTAHDVVREARIMAALGNTTVPVPTVMATCTDVDVIGVPFAVLELVEGITVRTREAARAQPQWWRQRAGMALVERLVQLHALPVADLGLDDLARSGNYVERQLRRWSQQWSANADGSLPLMDEVRERLASDVPEQQRTTLVHGDAKLDNCIMGTDAEVKAIVDWELAALGDPLADLGLLLAYWGQVDDVETALQDPPSAVEGFATRQHLINRYRELTDLDLSPLQYHLAFSYWKIACILHGVAARLQQAGGDQDEVERIGHKVRRLATMAYEAWEP